MRIFKIPSTESKLDIGLGDHKNIAVFKVKVQMSEFRAPSGPLSYFSYLLIVSLTLQFRLGV